MSHRNARSISHARRTCAAALCTLAACAAGAATAAGAQAQAPSGTAMADWTSVASNTASGTLLGADVSLKGPRVWEAPSSRVDGSWSFSGPAFSPALPASDMIQISGNPGTERYTLHFGARTKNPILELGSLGSTITFHNLPADGRAIKLSGEAGFDVNANGTVVSGIAKNPNDVSGTILLLGTYKGDYTFTASYPGNGDGILVQLVARVQCADWYPASANTATGSLLGASVTLSRTGAAGQVSGIKLDGSSAIFSGPAFTPALTSSDVIQFTGPAGGPAASYGYKVEFGAPIADPIFQLGSLGSRITFDTFAKRVSGDAPDQRSAGFTASGPTTVSGSPTNLKGASNLDDASGTARLAYDTAIWTLTFQAAAVQGSAVAGGDGVYVQICAAV